MVFWREVGEVPEGFISLDVAVFSMTDRIRAVDPNFRFGTIYFEVCICLKKVHFRTPLAVCSS